jgi:hypothetical protein
MNRFLPPITCGFVVIVATLVSSCSARDYAAPGAAYAAPRDAALRECNGKASEWTDRDWETTKAATYMNCMTNHVQTP